MCDKRFDIIKDDAIEVWIFLNLSISNSAEATLLKVKNEIKKLSAGYIWHKDIFDISIPIHIEDLPPHLYSLTYFGDNIEDEWFIVYMMVEISRNFPELVIKINDSDGEFLLIEAADVLPKWANPETCDNRVFIKNGTLHLIPPSLLSANNIKDAVSFLWTGNTSTNAPSEVQNLVFGRISQYAQGFNHILHRTLVMIPLKHAAILHCKPDIISHAVNSYCSRDTLESKSLINCNFENIVYTPVVFTKCLYAMLSHSKLIFESRWNMPPKNIPDNKRKNIGIKLALGLELILNQASDNPFETRNWIAFRNSLNQNGYFKENIEGSKGYNALLKTAKTYFVENECRSSISYLGNQLKELIHSKEFDNAKEKLHEGNKQDCIEDSDEWLNMNPDDLNDFLEKKYGKVREQFANNDLSATTLTNKLSQYLNKPSNLEGIEVGAENSDDEDTQDTINFEADKFAQVISKMLNLEMPADESWNLDSGTDMSEYGSDDDSNFKSITENMAGYQCQLENELTEAGLKSDFQNTFANLKHGLKEEGASFGPTSSLLSGIGIDKRMISELDSDDDDDPT